MAFIVPGMAKSAGTIIVMSGDDILMEPVSSLGPIDAQLFWQGKQFSADAFLEGLKKIKKETDEEKALNRAYIPILQNISPGDIQHAENALKFAETLVTNWLEKYKFKNWLKHSSSGKPVTDDERKQRAEEIAGELCKHSRWFTHARSIKIKDLEEMRVKITDYSKNADLHDAIRRYYILLRMSFDSNTYKVFETVDSQVYRFLIPPASQSMTIGEKTIAGLLCRKCNTEFKIQFNFKKGVKLEEGCFKYPSDDIFRCPSCGEQHNLSEMRRQLELQAKKEVVR
ncbi:MAG: hypothetical protein V3R93_06940 [Candidatus Hydrothermarchaeaceae archaeon]